MTKTLIAIFILSAFSVDPVFAQPDHSQIDTLRSTLHKIFQLTKQHSVYRNKTDWITLEDKIFKDLPSPLSIKNFEDGIKLIFSGIGDKHAAVFVNGKKIDATDTPFIVRKELLHEFKTSNLQLHTRVLENKYGYILIPSNTPKDNLKQMAQSIQDSLCKLVNLPLQGIILDLRANEGGSIFPLFTGLHQIIGNGVFGAFSNLEGTFKEPWQLKYGKFIQQKRIVASVKPDCNCSDKLKVAVLLSQVTASAGEMLAIALKGRANTIFIGEKTYGLTTGNITFKIDGYLLALSASFCEDRMGNVYNSYVTPDIEMIAGDNLSDIMDDKKVLAALAWFNFAGKTGLSKPLHYKRN